MTARDGSDYFELSDYIGLLRRHWLAITALTVIGLAVAAGYFAIAPKTYTATTLVQVNALPTDVNALGGRTSGPVNMDNENQIVQSASVAAVVKSRLRSPLTVADLIKDLHVVVPPNTTFLQISCDQGTAYTAQQCADATAQAYLSDRRSSALSLITSAIDAMNAQALSLQISVQQLESRLASRGLPASAPSRLIDELQLKAKLSRLSAILAHVNALTPVADSLVAADRGVAGRVVTPAIRPSRATSPHALLVLPSGLAAGLIIGLGGAFFLDRRRPRIHSARDVERLADVPALVSLDRARKIPVTSIAPPWSKAGQALAELAQYAAAALGDEGHVLLVAGTARGSGSSIVAANLACSLARTRGETVLVFPQARGTALSRLLGAVNGRGFAELLAGTATMNEVAHRMANWPRLRVIASGSGASDAAHDLQFDKARGLISELREEARYVIIDVRSAGEDATALGLAEFADAAVVVVQAEASRTADVLRCVRRLRALQTTVIGAAILPAGLRPRASARKGRRADPDIPGGAAGDRQPTAVPAQAMPSSMTTTVRQGDDAAVADPLAGS